MAQQVNEEMEEPAIGGITLWGFGCGVLLIDVVPKSYWWVPFYQKYYLK